MLKVGSLALPALHFAASSGFCAIGEFVKFRGELRALLLFNVFSHHYYCMGAIPMGGSVRRSQTNMMRQNAGVRIQPKWVNGSAEGGQSYANSAIYTPIGRSESRVLPRFRFYHMANPGNCLTLQKETK